MNKTRHLKTSSQALRSTERHLFYNFLTIYQPKNKLINQVNSWLINQQGRKELSRKHVFISQSRDYEIKKLDLWTWWHFSSVSLWGDKSHWWHIREKIRCGEGHCSGSNNCSSCKNRLQINPTRLLNMDESVIMVTSNISQRTLQNNLTALRLRRHTVYCNWGRVLITAL